MPRYRRYLGLALLIVAINSRTHLLGLGPTIEIQIYHRTTKTYPGLSGYQELELWMLPAHKDRPPGFVRPSLGILRYSTFSKHNLLLGFRPQKAVSRK